MYKKEIFGDKEDELIKYVWTDDRLGRDLAQQVLPGNQGLQQRR